MKESKYVYLAVPREVWDRYRVDESLHGILASLGVQEVTPVEMLVLMGEKHEQHEEDEE